ncbi:hypothetical protein IWW51_001027, partial [Coemansia sp. RSA 2702]
MAKAGSKKQRTDDTPLAATGAKSEKAKPKEGKPGKAKPKEATVEPVASPAAEHAKDVQVSFKSTEEIQQALDTRDFDLLIQGYTHLREHLRICNRTTDGASSEARVLRETNRRIVYEWAESQGVETIAKSWEHAQTHAIARLEGLIPVTIGRLIEVLDTAETFARGSQVVRLVLDNMRAMHRAISTPRSSACAAALQLLRQVVVFGSGEHADELRQLFDWTHTSVDEVPTVRSSIVGFSIRRLWTRFVLAFFVAERCRTASELLRTRGLINGLFRSVERDSYAELHTLLSTVFDTIVMSSRLTRADKRRVFGVPLMSNLAKAARNSVKVDPQSVGVLRPARFVPTGPDSEEVIAQDSVAEMVVRFFRGMMTYPGHGICYRQHGLYPAPSRRQPAANNDDMHDVATFTRASASAEMQELSNGLILRVLVACIDAAGSRAMGELAVDVLRVSPELIAPFWRNTKCSFEPRLSLRYLGATALAVRVLALPLPAEDAREPPRLHTVAEHIMPHAIGRSELGRALQMRTAPLVRYRALLIVELALRKLGAARAWIRAQPGEQWRRLEQRLVAVIRQRIPEWQMVRLVLHDAGEAESTQQTLLRNVLVRVVHGYQQHFAEIVLEARFDGGRLLADERWADANAGSDAGKTTDAVAAHTLLHLLQTLAVAPGVRWLAPATNAADSHTNMGAVLAAFLFAAQPEVRQAARTASISALRATGLFDHDTSGGEAACWLDALAALASPQATRGARLTFVAGSSAERGHTLIAFVEEAAKHASRLPYKYADRVHASNSDGDDGRLPFSPLLAAIVEAVVLKAAVGSGVLATRLRGLKQAQIAGALCTNAMVALVCEVMCRIAEAMPWTTQSLTRLAASAAEAVLAPRLAKLGAAKAEAKQDEVRHFADVTAAFTSAIDCVLNYFTKPVIGTKGGSSGKLPAATGNQLKRELDQACADIESGLGPFMSQLADAVCDAAGNSSVPAVSQWLLGQAHARQNGERQATFIATISWIALHDRVGQVSGSLWDTASFAELAAEIMQIDDLAFLEALFRHLLVSKRPGKLLRNPQVQRLLTHMLLATRGSTQFCAIVAQLVGRLTDADSGVDASGVSLVCVLVAEQLRLLAAADTTDGRMLMTQALEHYSQLFGAPLLPKHAELQQMLDFGTAVLVRSSCVWLAASEATRVWAQFIDRVSASSLEALSSGSDSECTVYWLSLLRIVAGALADDMRVRLMRELGTAASNDCVELPVLCAVANTAFALSATDSHKALAMSSGVERTLTLRVVGLWASSLVAQDSDTTRLLEDAVKHATDQIGTDIQGGPATSIGQRIQQIAAQLPRLDRVYSDASIDVGSVLDRLWSHTESEPAYVGDSGNRLVLGRILANDAQLRTRACSWVGRVVGDGQLSATQCRFLVWLAAAVSAQNIQTNAQGLVSWDNDECSQAVRACCLDLCDRLFGRSLSVQLKELASDSALLSIATMYVQHSSDGAAVRDFCDRIELTLTKPAARGARATLLCAMALRARVYPAQPDMVALALAGALDMAQQAVPSPDDVAADAGDDAVVQMANIVEQCQQAAADRPIADAEAALSSAFDRVTKLLGLVSRPFVDGVDLSSADVTRLALGYPPALFRLLAFAVHTAVCVASISKPKSDAKLAWFAVLRQLLNCRFYTARVHSSKLRDSMALLTQGLWKLAQPSLSRWSASLDDYFALDELEALAGAYTGSRSAADQLLFQVICEYEGTTRQSVQRVAMVFGSTAADVYERERIGRARYFIERDENDIGTVGQDTVANALASVDSSRLLRTITEFPVAASKQEVDKDVDRKLLQALADPCADTGGLGAPEHGLVYDVQFILPWLWSVVSSGAGADVRRLIDSNALGVAVAALSSESESVRKLAYFTLDVAYGLVTGARALFGRSQCALVLDTLRNSITGRTSDCFPRVPFTVTLFVATSLPIALRPEHSMYAATNRLMLRRPWLRYDEVPLLRAVLRASPEPAGSHEYVLRMASQMSRAFGQCADTFRRAHLVNTVLAHASTALSDVHAGRAALATVFHLASAHNAEPLALHVSKNRFPLLTWIHGQLLLESNALVVSATQTRTEHGAGSVGAMQGVFAAACSLTALVRVVIRVVANFPLARSGSGQLLVNRFWVVQTPEQLTAAGQSAVISVLHQVLDRLACALASLGDAIDERLAATALTLVRSCMAVAQLLADMQAAVAGCSSSLALQQARLVPAALAAVRLCEPLVQDAPADPAVYYDPCAVAAVAESQSVDSLFAMPEQGLSEQYTLCVDELF